uniref:Rad50/SbcC-type AAA domain-containing protein n=1 Tax=Staphylococcus epidermidis TaxID=1282 RepID=A0A0K0PS88_STAEP|nr:PHP-associated domain-containing protein [Staphylococcus epidermidis]AKQ51587.1 hypothetical protein [Staphylococcus epidermidis]
MELTGARWWKVDFHTHTPASNDYGKGPDVNEVKKMTPRDWLLQHMKKEIDCVVITDHNSGAWIDCLKDELIKMENEKIQGYRKIYLFPGVEISVSGGLHLLAIFDLDKTTDDITSIVGNLQYSGTRGDSDGITSKTFNQSIDIIHEEGGIAIPAHVDKPKGLFEVEKGVTLEKSIKNENLLAIELCDTNYSKPQLYKGLDRKLAEIAGSDSHHPNTIGSVYTWVKMEKPNLNALKLSLHDCEDGILRMENSEDTPNDIQNRNFIKSIKISMGAKVGRNTPLNVNFSPWMNSIIGGRGSGKSSIIEFIRLPFNQVNNLPPKVKENFDNFNQVPEKRGKLGMLTPDSEVSVIIHKDGRDIELTWKDNKIIEKNNGNIYNWETQEELKSLSNRFPIRIFSQKHLYELTEDPKFLINIIDEQWDKLNWDTKNEELAQSWLNNRSYTRKLKKDLESIDNLEALLRDIQAKIDIYDKSEYQQILNDYQKHQLINNKMDSDVLKVRNYHSELLSKFDSIQNYLYSDNIYEKVDEITKNMLIQQDAEFKDIQYNLKSNIDELGNLICKIDKEFQELPWLTNKEKNKKSYDKIMNELEEFDTNGSNYEELIKEKTNIEEKIEKRRNLENRYRKCQQDGESILIEIEKHQKLLRRERICVVNNWIGENEKIRIYIEEMGDSENAESEFRKLIRKDGKTVYSKDILDFEEKRGFIYDLIKSQDVWTERENIVSRLNEISKDNNFSKAFYKHILDIKNNTPEDLDRIMIWYPEDKVVLKMVNNNNKEEDIATGSAGQRTAAMLSLMLRLDHTPIIIDQPEEDLDTRRITDLVVEDFKNLKKKQQIITITHNPNIPVNGASENIIQMNFAGGQINKNVEGALQKEEVRRAVCEIMEGGKDALDKRYYRVSRALREKQ